MMLSYSMYLTRKRSLCSILINAPKRFVDVETGSHIDVYAENIKENYEKAVEAYFNTIKLKCGQYKIKYVEANINEDFNKILTTYMLERQKFA